jgi:hypothetical protein
MWIDWVEWRIDYQPQKIKKKDLRDTSFRKCLFLWKQNNKGCPCIVVSPGATNDHYTIDEIQKVIAYNLDKASRICDKNGTTQMCVIFDRTNMTNKKEKIWLPIYKEMSTMIQDYYPERLHQAYVLHLNWFGKLMYGLCKPFIAKKTRNKVKFLSYTIIA